MAVLNTFSKDVGAGEPVAEVDSTRRVELASDERLVEPDGFSEASDASDEVSGATLPVEVGNT